jgi:MFS family permease
VADLGAQATLVALPFQLYVLTRSAFLVGLLGAVELLPLIALSLLGGALADRYDRRRVLLVAQVGVLVGAGGLALAAFLGHPAVIWLYLLAAVLAGFNALQNVAQSAIVPNLVEPERLPQALGLNYGLYALTMVLGPGLGGVMIGVFGVPAAYLANAAGCLAFTAAILAIGPQPPTAGEEHENVVRSITEGLRYVLSNRALVGSFAIDLVAMTFGMPRALFAVLAVGTFHAGAVGTGILYAAVAAGATAAAILTGWLNHARRLGVIVIWAVVVWGAAIALVGVMSSLWAAAALLAVAGAADSVSAVCRTTINQTVTPDHMRGRMSAVFSVVVSGGPRLGDLESGTVAGAFGVRVSIVSGGLLCLVGVGAIVLAFPQLARYDSSAPAARGELSRVPV